MSDPHSTQARKHAREIWQAGVNAVLPDRLMQRALANPELQDALQAAKRILVVGAGKAGATMSAALESALPDLLHKMHGIVNVPDDAVRSLQCIRLHGARPTGSNQPTSAGIEGTREILRLLKDAGPEDVAICLLSGGGSALLPAPSSPITLEEKQQTTAALHACGATINEMNAVRKHLSDCKGGRLAQAFNGKCLYSLILSDVVGDPLDVIASGPTAADPTIFADALAILEKYRLPASSIPASVIAHLRLGASGKVPETLKSLPSHIRNWIVGNNAIALQAASAKAAELGYRVINLGSFVEGDTQHVAGMHADIARSILKDGLPDKPPICLISGGETIVKLPKDHGLGGRNQEFVLACLARLDPEALRRITVLSGGTDGEDGPTTAAGAIGDSNTLKLSTDRSLRMSDYLERHDAYHFFQATNDLLITGLTGTNVMDIRVLVVEAA